MLFLSKHRRIIIHSSFGKDTVFLGEISRKGSKLTRIENGPAAFILELEKSNEVIRQLRAAMGPNFPIIGVGGILSGDDAVAKIKAGADVVQIYTGLIYKGPALVKEAALAIRNRAE